MEQEASIETMSRQDMQDSAHKPSGKRKSLDIFLGNAHIRHVGEADLRIISNAFDPEFYQETNSDVDFSEIAPLQHFASIGWLEGRDPSINFSISTYLEQYDDVRASGKNPLLQYLLDGKSEGRQAFLSQYGMIKGEFDPAFYRLTNKDVDFTRISPIRHFAEIGWREGRDPSPRFSVASYLKHNSDVREASVNPLLHYVIYGRSEGRQAFPSDQVLETSFIHSLILPQETVTEKALSEGKKLTFNVDENVRAVLREHFDNKFYKDKYPEIAEQTDDYLGHYVTVGVLEGRDPAPWFSTDYYTKSYSDVANAGINPFLHYTLYGHAENRQPKPNLDEQFSLDFDPRDNRLTMPLPVAYDRKVSNETVRHMTIGVHIHCYYPELITLVMEWVKRIPATCRIFVSTPNEANIDPITRQAENLGLKITRLAIVPNRGRDLAPMVAEFHNDLLACDVALHVHTKKSVEQGEKGPMWRKAIESNLVYNDVYCCNILRLFESDPLCGAVVPVPHEHVRPFMVWGQNRELASSLLDMFGVGKSILKERRPEFPAGSMFWFKPAALKKILSANLTFDDFPAEPIADDGTLAHALERCLTHVIEEEGHYLVRVKPLPYHLCWPQKLPRLVSVIIPVYNSLPWLIPAVASVLMQSAAHAPLEVILVDNNSTDGSRHVMERLATLYDNVRLLSQPVQGAGAARNCGLEAATGEYVMFLDADDVLLNTAIEKLVAVAQSSKTPVDCVTSSLVMFTEDIHTHAMPFGDDGDYRRLDNGLDNDSLKLWSQVLSDFGPCAKLYRRDFLLKNGIRFPEGVNFEDNSFIYDVYLKSRNLFVLNSVTYLYRRYETKCGSTQSTSLSPTALHDQLSVMLSIIKDHTLSQPGRPLKRLALKALMEKIKQEVRRFSSVVELSTVLHEHAELFDIIEAAERK